LTLRSVRGGEDLQVIFVTDILARVDDCKLPVKAETSQLLGKKTGDVVTVSL